MSAMRFQHKQFYAPSEQLEAMRWLKKTIKDENFDGIAGHLQLSLFIMEERRNPLSSWRSWLNVLPVTSQENPVFWSQEELDWLQGSLLQKTTIDKKQKLEDYYAEIAGNVPEFSEEYSLQEFVETNIML